MTVNEYINENYNRLRSISAVYDPVVGTQYCDAIKRTKVVMHDAPITYMYVPDEMLTEPIIKMLMEFKSIRMVAKKLLGGEVTNEKYCDIWFSICELRCKHDFEFFCVSHIAIAYKGEGKSGPYVLNRAQRYFLSELEKLRKAGRPIDVILLKARQWGGSTMVQFYMFWIQMFWRDNWNSCIVAEVDDQAKGVLAKLTFAAEHFKPDILHGKTLSLPPFGGTDSVRKISCRNCTISVGSAQHPSKIRSQDISMAHLTEVGIWKKTEQRTPEEVVASVFGSINPAPYTLKVLESTARGIGNYFHHTWLGATGEDKDYKNSFTPVFVPWFMIDIYSAELGVPYAEFIKSMTPYEKMLFDLGATLEAINWYRIKLLSMQNDTELMMQEFPSTPNEAFRSSGNRFYPAEYVNRLRKGCDKPIFVGEIGGAESKGEKSLDNVQLYEATNGCLKVWIDRHEWSEEKMSDRYLVVVDIGGRSKKADRSVICVFDRYWMHEIDGIPEVAAEWCGHIEHDLLAWKAAQIAHYYDDALLVVESNTLETKGTEGNHFNTLLVEIAGVYENMYRRTKQEEIDKGGVARYGFHTNSSTKPEVCDWELVCLRDGLYVEHCAEAVEEHETFEIKPNGELGAIEGSHDDRHITRAIGNYFNYKKMSRPKFITAESQKYTAGGDVKSEYDI